MSILIAYAVAFFIIGGLGGLIVSVLAMPLTLFAAKTGSNALCNFVAWLMGFGSGWLALYIGVLWFQWIEVDFGYIALAAIYVPLMYNDSRRAQGGAAHEKIVLAGTFSSLLVALLLMAGK